MLCKRPTRKIEESVREMQGRKFILEEKLDGERMQLHKRGNEYFYCSRSVVLSINMFSVCHNQVTESYQEREGLHLFVWEACRDR